MEVAQPRGNVEESDNQNLSEFQVQASGPVHVMSSLPQTRLLHLEHFPSHGKSGDISVLFTIRVQLTFPGLHVYQVLKCGIGQAVEPEHGSLKTYANEPETSQKGTNVTGLELRSMCIASGCT